MKVSSSDALTLWADRQTPIVHGNAGKSALVGLLFDRASGEPVDRLPSSSDLERLITRDFWGAYVLLTTDGSSHSVLRDPSAAVPVYCGRAEGLEIYATDADLLALARPERFRPELDFIRHWLTFPFLRTWRTGAAGVRELLPGTARRVDSAGEQLIEYWTPSRPARPRPLVTSLADAAALLRDEALRTIARFALAGEEIVLNLSGGLDSSIVAAALAQHGSPFRAITFATRSPDGDERRFARDVAARCGIELAELLEDDFVPDSSGASSPLRPPPNPLLQPLHRAIAEQATLSGAGLLLDGAGGDNVFAYLNTPSPVLDAFRSKGGIAAWRTLRDIADLHGCTLWSAAKATARRAWRGRVVQWPRDSSFLAPDAALAEPDRHPWLSAAPTIPAGTADHIRMIVGIHHFLADPSATGPAALHPLLAQPLMELCLAIPTWLWLAGGRDRAVARAAFRGLVPDRILDRRGKGRLESMFMKGYMAARPELEQFLVDGRLAADGIIDADAVSAYVREPDEPRDAGYIRLLEIAAAEQWLRSFPG